MLSLFLERERSEHVRRPCMLERSCTKVRGSGDREISLLVDFMAVQHLNMGG